MPLNPASSWLQELWRIALLILAAWLLGALLDQVAPMLFLALLAYTLRNLFNLQRLANWLGDARAEDIPIRFGVWGDIYSRIARVSRRQAQREKRLSTLLQEYTSSTSALPDAAVALDAEGRIRWFNDAASHLLGFQAAKDIGQPLLNLLRAPEMVSFVRRKEHGASLQIAAPGNTQRQIEVRMTPYGEGQTLLLAQDITERLQHERMRKDFVANVSHELRTPLTVISGFIENLQLDESTDPRLSRPLELMAQQTERMRRIVEDLLLLARLESASAPSQSTAVDIARLLESVADEGRSLRDDAPSIRCQIDSQRGVLGDEDKLRSALTNLVVNAVNHTPDEGSVTLIWHDEGASSVLTVSDTGQGIGQEHLPRLTERFYRVDTGRSRALGGTGLGLAIVKHILNRHDASLRIESELGKGSHFRCVFPASRLIA